MKEAQNLISQQQAVYIGRLDTLELLYNQAVNTYTERQDKFSKSEKQNLESLISKSQEDYAEYQQVAQNKIDEYTEKITQGVLNQVNDAVKVYAEKNNFDIVIGSNLTGNILYAKEQTDITTDIIDLLNSRQ
jgi:outer membrane protein